MHPQIRIIDNKKISMTNPEWEMYQSICRSYDRPNFKGEDLFKGLFESDENGLILFIKPPSSRFTSMEVFMFISAIMLHQHIREMHSTASTVFKQLNNKMKEIDDKLNVLSATQVK